MSKQVTRAFLDTDVIISGLCTAEGAPAELLDRFVRGQFVAVVSHQTLEEAVLTFKNVLPDALFPLEIFLRNVPPEVIKRPSQKDIARWSEVAKEDAEVLASAILAGPDCVVTLNRRLLATAIARETGLTIVTPARFLASIVKR
ncbi:MAG: PIN domain-containing protein [Dehalococcoidia bacterium]|nr:PIN domain-containing protein [Dehalococcoidia bacterium]